MATERSTPTGLTKVTVNLIPKSVVALDAAATLAGLSRTDTMNRALQVYAFIEQQRADGWALALRHEDGRERVVEIL